MSRVLRDYLAQEWAARAGSRASTSNAPPMQQQQQQVEQEQEQQEPPAALPITDKVCALLPLS